MAAVAVEVVGVGAGGGAACAGVVARGSASSPGTQIGLEGRGVKTGYGGGGRDERWKMSGTK